MAEVQGDRPVNGDSENKCDPRISPEHSGQAGNQVNQGGGGANPMKGPMSGNMQQLPQNSQGGMGMMRSPMRMPSTGASGWGNPRMNSRGMGGGIASAGRGYHDQTMGYGSGRPQYQVGGGGETLSRTNIYIRGLSPNTTDQDLVRMCKSYGTIVSTKAIIDLQVNKCKGYGFVDFERASDAEKASRDLKEKGIQSQMAKQQDQDPTNLYVANLPDYVDDNYLESIVQPYGNVVSTRILRDQVGKSRGVGFCRMESKEVCEKIIETLNKKILPAAQEPLLIKFADTGNKRKGREFRGPMMGMPPMMGMGRGSYSMPGMNQQQQLMSNQVGGNWMYPQMAMSPVTPSSSSMDQTMLANQLNQMQIGQNYNPMQPGQQNYNQMTPFQGQGGMSQMGMVHQMTAYDVSSSPTPFGGQQGFDDQHQHYPSFGQI